MARDLPTLRNAIDGVDREILETLNRRAALAWDIGVLKRADGAAVLDPDRDADVINRLQATNSGPLKDNSVAAIWRQVMSACGSLERPPRVAYLGPAGTYTEQAALKFFGRGMEPVPCVSFDEVFHAATSGTADFGVVAVENNSEGVVTRSLDLLLYSPLHIVGETSLLIQHHLLRTTDSLEDIDVVLAHPQALAQCQGWLARHLPGAERRAVSSNAEGARLAGTNPSWAGIAGERAGSVFGLQVAARAIQDDASNRTRFAVVCLPQVQPAPALSGRDCVSLVVSVPNRPGAVHDILGPLKQYGVSMTRFESRPARSGQWEYYFYIDIEGHPAQAHVAAALAELQSLCAFFKVLGTYPVTE